MRIKLIEDLPMASSAELYQLSWAIERLLADPRRIVQLRSQLHTGQPIQYFSWQDGKLRAARVVAMHGDHVAIHDEGYAKPFKVHYAAILAEPGDMPSGGGTTPQPEPRTPPSPPPEVGSRGDFRVGSRVTFTDKNFQRRVGLIVRINQQTATLDCDGKKWRVGFELLQHLVDA